jgi:hypothetical protein
LRRSSEAGLAGAGALLPPAAAGGLAQARRHVFQARHLHLQLRFARVGMAVEDFDDDAGAVQHLRARGAFQVADLARRQLVIHDDELRLRAGFRFRGSGSCGGGALEALPRLGGRRRRHGADHAAAAGQRRQLGQLAAAQQRAGAGALAPLRNRPGHLVAERLHQASQLLEAGGMRHVVHFGRLDAHEDGARGRGLGFHRRSVAWIGWRSGAHAPGRPSLPS